MSARIHILVTGNRPNNGNIGKNCFNSDVINRRDLCKLLGGSIGSSVTLGGLGTASADCEYESHWADSSKDPSDFDDFDAIDRETASVVNEPHNDPYGYKWGLDTSFSLLDVFESDQSDSPVFRYGIGCMGYAKHMVEDKCEDPDSSIGFGTDTIHYHGAEIKAKDGSLYPNVDPEKIMVFPEPPGSNQTTEVVDDVAWTVLKGVAGAGLSSVGVWGTAGVIAANAVAAGVFNGDGCEEFNNKMQYNFNHEVPLAAILMVPMLPATLWMGLFNPKKRDTNMQKLT